MNIVQAFAKRCSRQLKRRRAKKVNEASFSIDTTPQAEDALSSEYRHSFEYRHSSDRYSSEYKHSSEDISLFADTSSSENINLFAYTSPSKDINLCSDTVSSEDKTILKKLSQYPSWKPQAEIYIKQLKESGCNDQVCREKLLGLIPNATPFQHLILPEDILEALEFSHAHCIFDGPSGKPIHGINLCRYSCCEQCEAVMFAVDKVVRDLSLTTASHLDISVQMEREALQLRRGGLYLLVVFIRWADLAGTSKQRVFNMAVGRDEVHFIRHLFNHVSKKKLQLAASWFDKCKRQHHCRVNTLFVPKRLVFVGDTSLPPRLVEVADDQENKKFKYAALSYCWGTISGTFTTTLDNIEDNKQGILLYKLPRTIQDAIRICRRLGLSYLWVDALCIIQDAGHTDWSEQSGQMRQIYSNAQITIAADDTANCAEGFWHWQEQNIQRTMDSCWVRAMPEPTKDILSTRGWALQERILSHRILHFSNTGINWECDQCCRYEDGKTTMDFLGLSYRAFRLLNRYTRHEQLGDCDSEYNAEGKYDTTHITDFLTSGSWRSVYFAWDSIIESYSEKHLTEPSDKLSAISGLASFVLGYRKLGADSYLAGLWEENLVEGLLWYVNKLGASQSPPIYIAPSWSWASVTGNIKYFHERYQFHFQPYVTVAHASCVVSQADPTGKVTGGVIHLSGTLVPVTLAVIPRSDECNSTYGNSRDSAIRTLAFVRSVGNAIAGERTVWYEVMCDEEMLETPSDLDHVHDSQCVSNEHDATDTCSLQNIGNTQNGYFCLSIGEMVDSFTGGRRHWFLVLQQLREGEETYRRIGIGYFQYLRRQFSLFWRGKVQQISLI